MKSYLHFTPGDVLIFQSIAPNSPGAIFGACLIFFLVSVGDRYLRAVCRGVEKNIAQRSGTKRLATAYHFTDAAASDSKITGDAIEPIEAAVSTRFILSHELSRGALAGLQSTLHYFLMLVVMTFNAAFIIAVIFGVVVGEVAFGRLNH
ncbi:Ctr copper transporter [Mycena filopes]|nr:Ctr copper transporter [Mycena filopes]